MITIYNQKYSIPYIEYNKKKKKMVLLLSFQKSGNLWT